MKKTYVVATLISTIFLQIAPFQANAQERNFSSIPLKKGISHTKNYREGEVIIKYKDAEKKEKALQKIRTSPFQKNIQQTEVKEEIADLNIAVLRSEKKTTKELIDEFKNSDGIEYVEPNYIKIPTHTPNDPYFFDQWAYDFFDDDVDTDIDAVEAWDIEQNTATETIVAVIDSGIDHNFPELAPNMWDGFGGCLSDTGASISCPNHGWDYVDNDNDPDDTAHPEYQWHGTHVASIFGAVTNDATGIAGISRYNTVKMMALRFDLDTLTEIKAINFAKNNGAKVINASFAGTGYSQAEKDAIDAFPGIVVTASGNGGNDNIGDNNDITPQYPCNYASNNIICVGAHETGGDLASFSNYGSSSVDVSAPGIEILGIQQDTYYLGSGTSFATPLVSGTAALLYAHKPSASISTIRETLLQSSEHKEEFDGKINCSRQLNLHNALDAIIKGIIPNENCNDLRPVYRFYSPTGRSHFFTISESEKSRIITQYSNEWRYEGIAYYVPQN